MNWVFGILVILGLLSYIQTKYKAQPKEPRSNPKRSKPLPQREINRSGEGPSTGETYEWPKEDTFGFRTSGTEHYQPALVKLAGPPLPKRRKPIDAVATLIPYSSNPHDEKAVRVEIDGQIVAHLSRDDARSFRRRLGAKKLGPAPTRCAARIWGGYTNQDGREIAYGVDLDIKPFTN